MYVDIEIPSDGYHRSADIIIHLMVRAVCGGVGGLVTLCRAAELLQG